MPCLCQGLCGAAFGAPGPGDHKGEYLETDFVVINHEVRQVFGQVLEGAICGPTRLGVFSFFFSESTCCQWLKYPTGMVPLQINSRDNGVPQMQGSEIEEPKSLNNASRTF